MKQPRQVPGNGIGMPHNDTRAKEAGLTVGLIMLGSRWKCNAKNRYVLVELMGPEDDRFNYLPAHFDVGRCVTQERPGASARLRPGGQRCYGWSQSGAPVPSQALGGPALMKGRQMKCMLLSRSLCCGGLKLLTPLNAGDGSIVGPLCWVALHVASLEMWILSPCCCLKVSWAMKGSRASFV